MFLVTVKPRVYARRILEHFELAELFDAVYGPELGDRQYTKAALVREACAAARLDAGRTIMIGDRGEDVAAAKESELRAVAVTWGYGARPELEAAQPDTLIDSADELVEYVRSIASDRRARAFEGEDR